MTIGLKGLFTPGGDETRDILYLDVEYNGNKGIYYLYPLTTYCMWNHDHKGVRLLVSFGAEVYTLDNYGYYTEEAIKNISYFHPIPYFNENENIDQTIYYRNQNDFKDVINEVFSQKSRSASHDVIDSYSRLWMQMQSGSQGFSGKKTVNARTSFNELFSIV